MVIVAVDMVDTAEEGITTMDTAAARTESRVEALPMTVPIILRRLRLLPREVENLEMEHRHPL